MESAHLRPEQLLNLVSQLPAQEKCRDDYLYAQCFKRTLGFLVAFCSDDSIENEQHREIVSLRAMLDINLKGESTRNFMRALDYRASFAAILIVAAQDNSPLEDRLQIPMFDKLTDSKEVDESENYFCSPRGATAIFNLLNVLTAKDGARFHPFYITPAHSFADQFTHDLNHLPGFYYLGENPDDKDFSWKAAMETLKVSYCGSDIDLGINIISTVADHSRIERRFDRLIASVPRVVSQELFKSSCVLPEMTLDALEDGLLDLLSELHLSPSLTSVLWRLVHYNPRNLVRVLVNAAHREKYANRMYSTLQNSLLYGKTQKRRVNWLLDRAWPLKHCAALFNLSEEILAAQRRH